MNKTRFSLIDWFLVVTIIGVLMASAFSARRDYRYMVIRHWITDGLSVAAKARVAVAKNIGSHSADLCADVATGTTGQTTLSCHKGVITASIATSTTPATIVLTLVPDQTGNNWTCTAENDLRYVPEVCHPWNGRS